jgi:uncharacterized SAM-binding protein YcdF (DUF218 family)
LTVAILLVAAIIAEIKLFVVPSSAASPAADIIVVLGGNQDWSRWRAGDELAAAHPGATLLLSVYPPNCPSRVAGAAHIVCFVPSPKTTQGEARFATAYARAHNAKSMVVVVTADQATRARLRFSRCWGGKLWIHTASAPVSSVLKYLFYENAALLKALVWQRKC